MEKYRLWQQLERGETVIMSSTCDGGQLAYKLNQVSAGVKLVDKHTIDPLSGQLLFGASGNDEVQSRNVCFLYIFTFAKCLFSFTSSHCKRWSGILWWTFTNLFSRDEWFWRYTWVPEICSRSWYVLSCMHTALRQGYEKHELCMLLLQYSQKWLGKATWNVLWRLTEDWMTRAMLPPWSFRRAAHTMTENRVWRDSGTLAASWKSTILSKIKIRSTGVLNGDVDPYHIELEKELKMRGFHVGPDRPLEELRLQLNEVLLVENVYILAKEVYECNNLDEAMIKLHQAIPCLLHLENRPIEAIISCCIQQGLSLVEGSAELTKCLMKAVELLINEKLFGRPGAPSNWVFPVNDDGTMGEIKFANWRAWRIIDHFDLLVDICLPGDVN